MNRRIRTVLAVPGAAFTMFVWGGLTQLLPWGVPTAQVFVSADAGREAFQGPNVQEVAAHHFTTGAYDESMVGHVSTLTTDATFSWIVTAPIDYYDPGLYMARECGIQLLAGLLVVALVLLTPILTTRARVGLVGVGAVLASLTTYGRLMNWWALPAGYAVGESVNLVVAWVLGAAVASAIVGSPPTGGNDA